MAGWLRPQNFRRAQPRERRACRTQRFARRRFRQLWDENGSAIIEGLKPRELAAYAELCGRTLARAHARSGDAAALIAYLGSGDAIDKALADFAELYADQNELDYAALDAAVKSGRVKAEKGL